VLDFLDGKLARFQSGHAIVDFHDALPREDKRKDSLHRPVCAPPNWDGAGRTI